MSTMINPASGPGIPLEVLRVSTPLGIRFWDLTLNVPVSDGLQVNLQLMNSQAPPLPAVCTSSGVYTFFGLPGLHSVEYPDGTGNFGPPRTYSYVVTVQDGLGRFLPMVLVYSLDQTGALLVNGVPDATPGARLAYLFSAPGRVAPPGIAMVRADLVDKNAVINGQNQPAAWAVVQAQVSGEVETWTGIADDQGRAALLFPYPLVEKLVLGSPPGTGQGNIADQNWPLSVQVQYSPNQAQFPLANLPDLQWPWTVTPSLKSILDNQAPATIWTDPVTPVSQLSTQLNLGEPLVLRSGSLSPPSTSSTLLISAGTSPP
jgi:hypothetical protein